MAVETLLAPGGPLSRALPGWEERPEQVALAREVERAFAERRVLVAEAGTGTGKTLAYLVPAALSGRKVVISTATKNLQDQLFHKDLPLLQRGLRLELRATLVKGRSNYLCLHRLERIEREPALLGPGTDEAWADVRAWADHTETGDRAELALPEDFPGWPRLTTTRETCLGTRCPLHEACFVTRLRARAEASDLVVVNHALFFADLALRTTRGNGEGVLPRYDAVVFDEAHALEDAATEFFGVGVSSHRFEELARDAQVALEPTDSRSGMLAALAFKLRSQAESLFTGAPRALGLGAEQAVRLTPDLLRPLSRQVEELLQGLAALGAFAGEAEEPEVQALGRRSDELGSELDFVRRAESTDHVYWAEGRGRGVALRAAPISVAEVLREKLYASVDTLVFTSATLRAGSSFGYFCRRLGLVDDAGEPVHPLTQLAVPSSFDYREQSALYLPTHLPEPNQPGFVEAVAEEVVALSELTGGRAFVLFTSLRNMEAVHGLLRDRLPWPALKQGEAPKHVLLEAFRAQPSVLFAAHSFWEGVDVPGEALSLVVMDKLPFASPGHPLTAARIEQLEARGEEPFSAYQLPEAALALRQGFGRLIRTRADRGIVALLDVRVSRRAYGRMLVQSLPPARRFRRLEPLAAWLSAGRGRSSGRPDSDLAAAGDEASPRR
ncbi:MAG TPA: ATP-dependent DNA helicase [Myxococcaceae bacterium]|nr:ATP-dependent DNA helicase [Myxococcaceae bacterium]